MLIPFIENCRAFGRQVGKWLEANNLGHLKPTFTSQQVVIWESLRDVALARGRV